MNSKNRRLLFGIVTFSIVLLVILWNFSAVFSALRLASKVVSFFLIGLCIAFIMNSPLRFLETKVFPLFDRKLGHYWQRMRRTASIFLSVLLIAGILFALVFMIIPELGRTVKVIGEQFPSFIEGINAWLAEMSEQSGRSLESLNMPQFDWVKIGDAILDLFRNGVGAFVADTVTAATSIVSSIINFVVGFVLALYILFQREKLSNQSKRILYAFVSEKYADRLIAIGRLANQIFCSFITGQFIEAVVLGGLCFLGMSILGFPFALMVSVLIGVTSFIPIFGAFIGLVIGAFLILVNESALQALWFILFTFALQQVEGNIIYPNVVGKRVMLPGLWVLTAVTLGGNIAGVLGMLISVPTCSLLYALLREAVDRRNEAKGIAKEKLRADTQ